MFQGQRKTQTRIAQTWPQYWYVFILSVLKTIPPWMIAEKVIYFLLLDRKKRKPSYEDETEVLVRARCGSSDPPRKRVDHCKLNGITYNQLSQGSPVTPRRNLYRWVPTVKLIDCFLWKASLFHSFFHQSTVELRVPSQIQRFYLSWCLKSRTFGGSEYQPLRMLLRYFIPRQGDHTHTCIIDLIILSP